VTALLDVKGLAVCFAGEVEALRGVSFALHRGESLAVIGETGSGKTTLALSLVGLIQPPEATGSIRIDGHEVVGSDPEQLRSLRSETVALALQEAPFNPVTTIGAQLAEPLEERRGMGRRAARARVEELAAEADLRCDVLDRYPHEVSGGERRRAALAGALALDPDILILDEPTAGLDFATKASFVTRLVELSRARGFTLLVIIHDLSQAARLAQRTMVLYAGEAMEIGDTTRVIDDPAHPYSWALANAYPVMATTKDLRPIRGRPPDARSVPSGCPFHPRCTQAEDVCRDQRVELLASRGRLVACHFGGLKTLLAARAVTKVFRSGGRDIRAVDDVSLELREGQSVGVIGPSGSGKTTLARILSGHLPPDAGAVMLRGEAFADPSRRRPAPERRRAIQLVMQDPWNALSPRMTVSELVREPFDLARFGDRRAGDLVVAEVLESVGLPSTGKFLETRTHELSGGQLQRVALARALAARPKILVADEPTSMLDASEQARLLVVLRERQVEMGLGLIFVSHDLAVVRKVTDHIIVLDRGRVVEEGPSHVVSTAPRSDTGRRLVEAAPDV